MSAPKTEQKIKEWKEKLSVAGKRPNKGHFKKGHNTWNKEGEGRKRFCKILNDNWKNGVYDNRDFNGNKNPNYIDGRETIPDYKYVLKERKNVCKICNSKKMLIVHHINRDRKDNSRKNLIILCQACHMVWHCFGKVKAYGRAR